MATATHPWLVAIADAFGFIEGYAKETQRQNKAGEQKNVEKRVEEGSKSADAESATAALEI